VEFSQAAVVSDDGRLAATDVEVTRFELNDRRQQFVDENLSCHSGYLCTGLARRTPTAGAGAQGGWSPMPNSLAGLRVSQIFGVKTRNNLFDSSLLPLSPKHLLSSNGQKRPSLRRAKTP